jgi:ATP-dependent DNA helicase RecG
MNIYDIIEMIKLGEGWQVEFKEMLSKPANLAMPIVAFANHQGGTILIGVNNKGQVTGVRLTHKDRDNILRAGRDGCRPSITNLEINEHSIDGKIVVSVHVPMGKDTIYTTSDGRYLVRQGSENVGADWRQLEQLMSDRVQGWFEQQTCRGASYGDIDQPRVQQYLKVREAKFETKIEMPVEDVLKSRRCVIEQGGKLLPTYAGIVLFGKEPHRFLQMAYATVVKFKGTDVAQGYSDRKDFHGCAVDLVDQILQWVRDRMYHGGRIPKMSPIREEIFQFYPSVVREIVVNAVAHRDYANKGSRILVSMFDDRLEIQSPGKLPGNVTPQNIRREQFARNPNILLTLMEWGYGELLGHGYDKVYRDLHREHYRDPKLEDTGGSFIVTLFAKDVEKALDKDGGFQKIAEMDTRATIVLQYIAQHGSITTRDFMRLMKKSRETSRLELGQMVKLGTLMRTGKGRSVRYVLKRQV